MTLKLPLETMEEMSFEEFGWLYEYHYEKQKEEYEILAHVISVGYARTQTKKKIKLFADKQTKQTVGKMTAEERDKKLDYLKAVFG